MRDFFILLIISWYANFCLAQEATMYHQFSVKDGIPSSRVYKIVQDSRGIIWMATSKGVVRYDGIEFVDFTAESGMTNNEIWSLVCDDQDRIWLLSFSKELQYIQYDSLQVLPTQFPMDQIPMYQFHAEKDSLYFFMTAEP